MARDGSKFEASRKANHLEFAAASGDDVQIGWKTVAPPEMHPLFPFPRKPPIPWQGTHQRPRSEFPQSVPLSSPASFFALRNLPETGL